MSKKILGLDLGTNSIGWALIESSAEEKKGRIIAAGSRILPMSQDILGKFDSGQSISQTAERTGFRSVRRLRERHLLRRERLHRVLNVLSFLPPHYTALIDFEKRLGQFKEESEPKLPYAFNSQTGKSEFIFTASFEEMLSDFAQHQPQLVANGKKVPYDWTIYYLRKKALTARIEKEELAWLLLNFNQKRGYYQLRGEEEEENNNKLVEFHALRVTDVVPTGELKGKDESWYNVHLENGWIYRRTSKIPLDWIGKTKEFIVTTELNEDGTIKKDKEGKEKRSFRAPAENDWTLVKKKTELDIDKSQQTVGAYIYDHLLQNPAQKIKGKLVRVVERRFYKAELQQILNKQKEFHKELNDTSLYQACLEELYEHNEAHRNSNAQKDFTHLFLNDIIFYQRPLKSKKSLIGNCRFENRVFQKNGKWETEPLKGIAKSNPLFQEFRLWQFLQNLKIYQREKEVNGQLQTDVNVTSEFLKSEEDWVQLFEWLNNRKEVDQKAFLKYPAFNLKKNTDKYRWNYVEDKIYPCNETRTQILTRIAKVQGVDASFLDKETEISLWHILYSVEDKNDLQKALASFAEKRGLGEDFVEHLRKFPPFPKEYGAYSAKALKKLLPLMRLGRYWSEQAIDLQTRSRIENLLTAEWDESIQDRVREKAMLLTGIDDFRGLPLWLASYIVYNRHSEDGEAVKWRTANDIELLQQHSLRNPIVEQVINESLQVVRDIWKQYGRGEENFFNEIHIELGREMKNPADKRKQLSQQINENENTNLRIKALLLELLNDNEVENVRPYSPMQQEILKIYEEGALSGADEIPEDILKISKQAQPTAAELTRYKLWLQQKYRSPYTGEVIPLSKLFTQAYEIEHIIPQSRYFDDSFSNKVICEAEVNKDKDNCTAYEYIKSNRGKKIELSFGRTVTLFTVEQYEDFVKKHYSANRSKMKKLLMEDIPEAFIQRQLNDSRYISKVVKGLMSNIVREEGEQEATSKHVVVSNGAITSVLKQDWGLNDVWNGIITPRFERLNELTKSSNFGSWVAREGKQVFQTQVPLELQKGFSKKRIDHRHHALDALVIACATRNHINFLNNESALEKGSSREEKDKKRYDLKHKLCFKKYNDDSRQHYKWVFHKPWETFTQEAKEVLHAMVVSFKQNLRVINKTTNRYQKWHIDETGTPKKVTVLQSGSQNWAIRKPMHKDTVSGKVQLKLKKIVPLATALNEWEMVVNRPLRQAIRKLLAQGFDKKQLVQYFRQRDCQWEGLDISKVEVYYWDKANAASRVGVDESFNSGKIRSITDTGIQQILLNHLEKYNEEKSGKIIEHPELAFSPDGLDEMNRNLMQLNGGKEHQPIFKVRTYEPLGNKFNVGFTGNKKHKYVEAAKGTNLFFAIYQDENRKRNYETIPLNIVIERQKQGLSPVPEVNEAGHPLLFHLSPNDLVYVPLEEELPSSHMIDLNMPTKEQAKRIYKFVSCTGNEGHFVPNYYASPIINNEMGSNNKSQNTLEGIQVKSVCIKLKADRLGNLTLPNRLSLFDEPGKSINLPQTTGINKPLME